MYTLLDSLLLLSIKSSMSENSSEVGGSSSASPSTPIASNTSRINFRDLKKELKGIEKLSKDNLDIKSWASELRLWIRYQHVVDPETIFIACILTSTGETREIIQDMEKENIFSDDDDDEDSDSDDENNHNYPSLNKIVDELEKFYGLKEDQNVLLRELRALKIKKNEKVKDFNIRYRTLYHKLDSKRRKRISVLDYADSLQNNKEAWKRVSLKDNISLNKAFAIAEKVDRLIPKIAYESEENNYSNYNKSSNFNKKKFKNKSFPESRKSVKDPDVDDLTKRMKNLTISTCFYCKEKGHYQHNCPKLKAIVDKNRQEFFENKNLNH